MNPAAHSNAHPRVRAIREEPEQAARPAPVTHKARPLAERRRASFNAFQILHWGFVALPCIAGADKFARLLVNWEQYLAPALAKGSTSGAAGMMSLVGVIELGAGLLVALKPRIGGYALAGWFAAIIANLLALGGHSDIVLRDFGLLVAALALGVLSKAYDRPRTA